MGDWLSWIGGGVLGCIGLALLLMALFADRSRGRRRCPKCWYDMSGVEGEPPHRCPECGKVVKRTKSLHKTRRRWGRAVIAALLLAVGLAIPKIRADGWPSLLPNTVLIFLLPWDTADEPIGEELWDRFATIETNRIEVDVDPDALWDWQWDWLIARIVDRALDDPNPESGGAELTLLVWLPRTQTSLRHLAAICESDQGAIRGGAAYAIGELSDVHGARDARATAAVVGLLQDSDPEVRWRAVIAIRYIGPPAADAVEPLLDLIRDEDPQYRHARWYAPYALAAIGTDEARRAVPMLIQMVDEADDSSRLLPLLNALGELGASDPRTVDILLRHVDHPAHRVRSEAIQALGKIGPRDPRGIEAIERAAKDPDESVRLTAVFALEHFPMGDAAGLRILRDLIDDGDESVRHAALRAFVSSAEEEAAIAVLRDRMSANGDVDTTYDAITAFAESPLSSPFLLDTLIQYTTARDPFIRGSAAEAMGTIASRMNDHDKIRSALTQLSEDADPWVRKMAIEALDSLDR